MVIAAISGLGGTKNTHLGLWARGIDHPLTEVNRQSIAGAFEQLGTGKRVAVDMFLLAYAVPNNHVYWVGSVGDTPVDAILTSPLTEHGDGKKVLAWANETFGGDWVIAYSSRGYVVLEHPGN